MWRNQRTALLPRNYCRLALALLAVLAADRLAVHARVQYTEGGSFGQHDEPSAASGDGEFDLVEPVNSQQPQSAAAAEEEAEEEERLASIVDELQSLRAPTQVTDEEEEPIELVAVPKSGASEMDELRKLGAQIRQLAESDSDAPATAEELVEVEPVPEREAPTKPAKTVAKPVPAPKKTAEKPLSAQKKGQAEFVDFVEPVHAKLASKKLKNRETLEKRVADYRLSRLHREEESGVGLLYSSGNMLFIAFVTMCCVLSVVGVVGGAYYYKHVRVINEDPFDDFTRYSPAGPGRDKLKKNFACEKGDETLAYKAQLHHYQQTKQKIIGDGLGSGHAGALEDDASDKSDDEADLEHNFSVYECPGLAPTGDIEVSNPNFVDSAASSPTRGP